MNLTRATWFKFHSWIGIKLSILLCFIFITGTLGVVSNELDWLTNPAMRVHPPPTQTVNWPIIYRNARFQQPDKHILSLHAPSAPWFSAQVLYYKEGNQLHRMFFHPSTGEFLGYGRWYNFQRFFRMAHRHLMLPVAVGMPLVGLLSLFVLLSTISSLFLYKNWWKNGLRFPRTSHRRHFWSDLHKLLGVWSLWLLLVASITGIWYLVEQLGGAAVYSSKGELRTQQAQTERVMPQPNLFEKMLLQTQQHHPNLQIREIILPYKAGKVMEFQGQTNTPLVRNRANLVSFDPVSGDVLAVRNTSDLTFHARISEAADPLHFGTWGGNITKVFYFVFGCFVSVIAISGTYMYGLRMTKTSNQTSTNPSKTAPLLTAVRALGWIKWYSIFLIVLCLLVSLLLFTGLVKV